MDGFIVSRYYWEVAESGDGAIRKKWVLRAMALKAVVHVRPHPVLALSLQRQYCERPHLAFHTSSVMMLSLRTETWSQVMMSRNLRNSEPKPASFHPASMLVTEWSTVLHMYQLPCRRISIICFQVKSERRPASCQPRCSLSTSSGVY